MLLLHRSASPGLRLDGVDVYPILLGLPVVDEVVPEVLEHHEVAVPAGVAGALVLLFVVSPLLDISRLTPVSGWQQCARTSGPSSNYRHVITTCSMSFRSVQ